MKLSLKKLPCGDYLVTWEDARRVRKPWYAPWRWHWEPLQYRSHRGTSSEGWYRYPSGHYVTNYEHPQLPDALRREVVAYETRETWRMRDGGVL